MDLRMSVLLMVVMGFLAMMAVNGTALWAQESSTDTFDTRTVSIQLSTPNPNWSIRINSIYKMDDKLWVFSELSSRSGMAAAVISSVHDTVAARVPDFPVKHYVSGKNWNWDNDAKNVHFIGMWGYIKKILSTWTQGELLWYRDSKE